MSIINAVAVPHPPLIIPDVGEGNEIKISNTITAYRKAAEFIRDADPETVVITTPHNVMYYDYFHISPGSSANGDFGAYGAPQVKIHADYDEEFVRNLCEDAEEASFPAGTKGEKNPALDHATMIPIYFLKEAYGGKPMPKFVRISLSGRRLPEHYYFGMMIKNTADYLGRRVSVIASGDLSHKLKPEGPYGFAKEGPIFDAECMAALGSGEFLRLLTIDADLADGAAECGLRSFWIMAGALDRKSVTAEALSYEGPFGVGYGVAYFTVTGRDDARDFGEQLQNFTKKKMADRKAAEDPYVKLARKSIESYVKTGEIADMPTDIPSEITNQRAGAFVSLKKDGRLRGCIGTFLPVQQNLAMEIWGNAISACSRDPRFDPVEEDELPDLVYSVDVLSAPEPISSPSELDPKVYGVIVSCGSRRGLLLPDLAGVDTVEEQISIARQTGGIRPDEKISLQRFRVVRHH